MAFRLKRGESVSDGVKRVAQEELRAAVKNLALPPERRDKGIHEVRKSLKKLRAMLRLLEPVMDGEAGRETRRLRDAAREISGFRDSAVAIETLDGLLTRHRAAGDKGIAKFRASLVREKQTSEKEKIEDVLRRITVKMADAEGRARDWRITAEDDAAIREGLEHAYRRGRKALKAARGCFSGDLSHVLRMRVKDLWYDLRLLEGSWLRAGVLVKRLKEVETLLGEEHNLAMLSAKLPPITPQNGNVAWRQQLEKWIISTRAELCSRAEAISAEVYAEKPQVFVRRVLAGKPANPRTTRKAVA